MNEIKHSKPLTYRIYDYLKTNCVGRENAISGRDLSAMFGISPRQLRTYINEIRNSTELRRVVLSGNAGYFMATEEEFERYNKRLESQALSLLKVFHSNCKKAAKDGQFLIPLGNSYKEIFEAFGNEGNNA